MINPELKRNIWLDFTFHRVIILPIVTVLIVYLFYLIGGFKSSSSFAFFLACLLIFLPGTKNASEAVTDEVSKNTWDFQRQSSLSPWQMTWGKLIGSTLYNWYGAMICLAFYALGYSNEPTLPFEPGSAPPSHIAKDILFLIAGGLFSQALALLLSLQSIPQMRREKFNRSFRYFIAGLFIGVMMTSYCFSTSKNPEATILWYTHSFQLSAFAFTSLLLFLGWSLVGLQRSFSKELQYQHIPWIWLLFNVFCIVYFSGLSPSENTFPVQLSDLNFSILKDVKQQLTHAPLYVGFLIAQTLTYFALFTDTLSFIRYKYFITRLQERNIIETLQQLPWWPISFVLMLVIGIVVIIAQQQPGSLMENFSPAVFVITVLLFLVRDIALIHFFNFAQNPRNATGSAVLYLFILYLLLPLLLKALNMESLLPLLVPSWGENTVLAIISSCAQIGFIGYLALMRYKKLNDMANASSSNAGT